jgi:hypothetical protein
MEKQSEKPINPINLMTVNDFALSIGKTRQTVFNMVKEGRVEKVSFLGKEWIDKTTVKEVA